MWRFEAMAMTMMMLMMITSKEGEPHQPDYRQYLASHGQLGAIVRIQRIIGVGQTWSSTGGRRYETGLYGGLWVASPVELKMFEKGYRFSVDRRGFSFALQFRMRVHGSPARGYNRIINYKVWVRELGQSEKTFLSVSRSVGRSGRCPPEWTSSSEWYFTLTDWKEAEQKQAPSL